MIIYRCEDPNCEKDFKKSEELIRGNITIDAEAEIGFAFCKESMEKFKKYVREFFIKNAEEQVNEFVETAK